MKKAQKILNQLSGIRLVEIASKKIDSTVLKSHGNVKKGDGVEIEKDGNAPSLRKVFTKDGKFVASYDTRVSSEMKTYKSRYKPLL